MFDVGFVELLVIFVLGLLILGPERLPRVVSKLGRWIGKARRTASDLRRQLEREIELEEFSKSNRKPPRPPQRPSPFPPPDDAQTSGSEDSGTAEGTNTDSSTDTGSIWPPEDAPSAARPNSAARRDAAQDMTTGAGRSDRDSSGSIGNSTEAAEPGVSGSGSGSESDSTDSNERADSAAAGR